MANDDVVQGRPSKGFFVYMITRDISLKDAILDLLDNSVDGIRRVAASAGTQPEFAAFGSSISFGPGEFNISDNCGGIPIEVAKKYAFRFGKPEDFKMPAHTIGLYGIGMKRALFKMGRSIEVKSSTGRESFTVFIDVDKWRQQSEDNWDFPLKDVREAKTDQPVGTRITVKELYEPVAREFETPAFYNQLVRSVQRDYAFILDKGFKASVNDTQVQGSMPTLRESDDLAPMRLTYADDGVQVEIVAGLAEPPPEDDSSQVRYPEQDIYGWYAVCNERVVVTADKKTLTGWGTEGVPAWHAQYFGFIGVVRFESDDPSFLPWRTTKRDVDPSSPIYKRALVQMREASKEFISYTNRRKGDLETSRELERAAKPVAVPKVTLRKTMMFPKIATADVRRICFDKPLSEIEALGKALGVRSRSLKQVGIAAFDYARKREVDTE